METSALPAEVKSIPTHQLQPNPWNRTVFDAAALDELTDSIRSGGIEEPLIVRQKGESEYEIASGHRRWLAAQKAGLSEVPCLVRDLSDQKVAEMNIEINVQREELPPLELARMLSEYLTRYNKNQRETALIFGKTEGWISQYLGFLTLHPDLKNFTAVKFSVNDLRELKRLTPDQQKQIAKELAAGDVGADNIQKRCNAMRFSSTLHARSQADEVAATKPSGASFGVPPPGDDPLAEVWEPLQMKTMASGKVWGVSYAPQPIPGMQGVALPAWHFWVVNNGFLPKADLKRWFLQMAEAMGDSKDDERALQDTMERLASKNT